LSYEIIYGKQFVNLRRTREVIPMLLAGSNNCYDCPTYEHPKGRHEREWGHTQWFTRKNKLSDKPDIILKNLDAQLNKCIRGNHIDGAKPKDIRNHFGYYGSIAVAGRGTRGTSWNAFRSQFTNGIRNALTIEELAQFGVSLYFYDIGMVGDSPNGRPAPVDIITEPQYFVELSKWRAWQVATGKSFWVSFHPLSTDEVLRRLHSLKSRTPREKTKVEQDHYFVLTDGYNALVKYTRSGYRYSYHKDGGKRFMTEEATDQYKQQLIWNGRYKADIWKVERIEAKAIFEV
jgi:hypothetical protein